MIGGGGLAMDDALDTAVGGSDPLLDAWNVQVAVGLTAPYLLSRLCVPLLVAAGQPEADVPSRAGTTTPGCIIHVSSTRARQAEPNHEPYSAAKAGLLGLTRSMAASLGSKHGIRVNAIVPGWIDVAHECIQGDRSGAVWAQDVSAEDHAWHWVGRVGRVEDIVGAVEYLVSAGFVTGQEIVLDGGVSRRMVYPE
jgi:NAD(P)-dependent dehydrogenase (short-subunit alcohol dehydrogenase family)